MKAAHWLVVVGWVLFSGSIEASDVRKPVPLIFDTDIGNDCDDVLALGMIHALQARGECELLAVTITKDHPLAARFTDAVNTFYGNGDVPIGVCHSGITPEAGKFNLLAEEKTESGTPRYPHDLSEKSVADAVEVLRRTLAAADDGTVVICQVGFSTNLANLLASPPDKVSPLSGKDLVKRKVRLLSIMAGAFRKIPGKQGELYDHAEYNVVKDLPAAHAVSQQWPTPIVWSGFEIGLHLRYPHQSILRDYRYVQHHPLADAYMLYMPPPHDRPTWDLTAVLYAVRPEENYFGISPAGKVSVDAKGLTTFQADDEGRDRYLVLKEAQKARVIEALTLLSSQPPTQRAR